MMASQRREDYLAGARGQFQIDRLLHFCLKSGLSGHDNIAAISVMSDDKP